MSYLLWHRSGEMRIASPRLVLRAGEVPLLQEANALRDHWTQLAESESRRCAEAERERAQRVAAAEAAARAQGLAEGRAAGEHEAGAALAATLATLAENAERERERLRREVAALALQVARKLLGRLGADDVLVALADTAAREALPDRPIALIVHPERVDAVRARLAARAGDDGDDAATPLRCEVRADPACAHDACRLDTGYGTIDASLESQLARLAEAWQVDRAEERP